MEPEMNQAEPKLEHVIADLLEQNTKLRFELSVLRAMVKEQEEQDDIEAQMRQSQAIPPHVAEMLSKLDIR
jgi:regulator of replication initiation timing